MVSTQTEASAGTDRAGADVRLLFIGGWGRSGSTLAERLVGEMPDVAGGGEITHMWIRAIRENERCACGTPFAGCPFWSEVGIRAFGGWDELDVDEVLRLKHQVDRMRFVPRLALPNRLTPHRADLQRYLDLHRRVYAAVAEVSGARVVIDSSKHASLAFALRHDRALDLRVLHLVRDPRGVAYSWSKAVTRPEIASGDVLMPQYSMRKSSTLWTVHNFLFHVLSWIRTPVLRMRYEALIDDPFGRLAEIRRFLDLPAQPPAFLVSDGTGVEAHLATSHSVAGNPMRFQTGAIRLRNDTAWRSRMPAGKRRLVSLLTWPSRVRYGYVDTHRHPSGSGS